MIGHPKEPDDRQRPRAAQLDADVAAVGVAWALVLLAEARLGLGDAATALEVAEEALADARRSFTRPFEIDALLTRARALLGSGGASRAIEVEHTLAEASELIDDTGARCRGPVVHEVSAALARVRGDAAGADRELREAHRLFTEIGATGHARRVAQEIGSGTVRAAASRTPRGSSSVVNADAG